MSRIIAASGSSGEASVTADAFSFHKKVIELFMEFSNELSSEQTVSISIADDLPKPHRVRLAAFDGSLPRFLHLLPHLFSTGELDSFCHACFLQLPLLFK